MWNLIDSKTSSMPSRDTFPKNLAEVDYPPTFGLASLEKCAWSNVLIGNINLLLFDGPAGQSTTFYTGGLRPEVQPLTFYVLFLTKKVPLFL